MIRHVRLKNFKASRDVSLRLGSLTLLAGLNASGKSTVFHALAALRQSYGDGDTSIGLSLGGELVQLGTSDDVYCEYAEDDTLGVSVEDEKRSFEWLYKCPPNSKLNLLEPLSRPDSVPDFIKGNDFQFLRADRIVPDTMYPQASGRAQVTGFLGVRGEFTADFIATSNERDVSVNRRVDLEKGDLDIHPEGRWAPTPKLPDQLVGWMQCLSPGVRLRADKIDRTDEVLLQFFYAGLKRQTSSKNYRPTNVGFGLTYTLPIVTACLSARPGSLLLLENPEAHLHPQGQVALGELFVRCAGDGVQLVVETHSDHVLNGIRIAIKRGIGKLPADNVALHLFTRQTDTGEVWVQSPTLLADGRLSNWPDGFLNQWSKSLDLLVSK